MENFTVEKLVNSPSLKGLRVVAGAWNTGNIISHSNIIDNPDTYEWMTAGDFLLTTGYVFQDAAQQKKLVRELSDLNCAGLGIKVKRYWNEIPPRILQEADRCGLPVVEIPFQYSLAHVLSYIDSEVFQRQDTMLRRYQEAHAAFTHCALEGGGLEEIAKLAAERVENPVLITDSKWRLLSYCEHPQNPKRLADYLPLVTGETGFPATFTEGVPTETSLFTVSMKRRFPDENGDVVCRIIPVASGKSVYGYMIVWETVRKIGETDYMTMEIAAKNCAMERVKARQLEEAAHSQRRTFFDDLLQNRIASVGAVRSMSRIHGMDPDRPHICAVIRVTQPEGSPLETDHQRIHSILNIIHRAGQVHKRSITAFHRINTIIMLIPVETKEDIRIPPPAVCAFLEDMDTQIEAAQLKCSWCIGVSNVCKEFLRLDQAYLHAMEVIHLAGTMKSQRRLFYLNQIHSYHFLNNMADREETQLFVQDILGNLIEYDRKHKTQLVDTLETYFSADCNAAKAAKALFVHKNSLVYRLNRIKKVLGNDLQDAEERFNLQLALHLRKLM